MGKIIAILVCIASYALNISAQENAELPIVDIGYRFHQASFNSTGNYYNFSNIRYAEPPLGRLRFAAPQSPKGRSHSVDTGSVARICPQAYPSAAFSNQIYTTFYSVTGKTSLEDFQNATQRFDYPRNTPQDPRTTEDCLFLDVMVPKKVFDKRSLTSKGATSGAAVMVWIHGGGYAAGTKYDTPPAGLISRSQAGNKEGVIYVALNYRLGALGWLSGPSFAVDGTTNAGLYDQRLALEWVRDHIHLFGGDSNRVTVFGESAGGGSIIHQIAAFGGEGDSVPFQRAIVQSSGFVPVSGNHEQEKNFQKFLGLLNVTTLAEAQMLPSSAIQKVNEFQVRTSKPGSFTFGPAVDGLFVPETLGLLLLHGRFHRSVDVMVGNNAEEGLAYPFLDNNTAFEAYIKSSFPNAPNTVHQHITQILYPEETMNSGTVLEDYDPTTTKSLIVTNYNTSLGRQAFFTSDSLISCLTYHVNRAFKGRTYSYLFSVPPSLHGQELYYVFYNEQATDVFFRPINITLAHMMQDYWLNFAQWGDPNSEQLPHFARWGNGSNVQGLSLAGVGPTQDITNNERCRWWQLGLYV